MVWSHCKNRRSCSERLVGENKLPSEVRTLRREEDPLAGVPNQAAVLILLTLAVSIFFYVPFIGYKRRLTVACLTFGIKTQGAVMPKATLSNQAAIFPHISS